MNSATIETSNDPRIVTRVRSAETAELAQYHNRRDMADALRDGDEVRAAKLAGRIFRGLERAHDLRQEAARILAGRS